MVGKGGKMTWRLYQKKPVIITATQWQGTGDLPELVTPHHFTPGAYLVNGRPMTEYGEIEIRAGIAVVYPRDWIINEPGRGYYVMSPLQFETEFDLVE